MSRQVVNPFDRSETALPQQYADGIALVKAVFEKQVSARVQMIRSTVYDGSDHVQAVGAAGQGASGFETHIALFQVWVCIGDVRRITDNDMEYMSAEIREPVTGDKLNIPEATIPARGYERARPRPGIRYPGGGSGFVY